MTKTQPTPPSLDQASCPRLPGQPRQRIVSTACRAAASASLKPNQLCELQTKAAHAVGATTDGYGDHTTPGVDMTLVVKTSTGKHFQLAALEGRVSTRIQGQASGTSRSAGERAAPDLQGPGPARW